MLGKTQVWPVGVPGRLHGGGCLELTEPTLIAGMRTNVREAEDGPSEGWQAVVWTEVRRQESLGPTWGSGRAGEARPGSHASPRALFPRGSGVPAARREIWARQQSGNGHGASPGTAGTRPGSAAAAPQLLFRPRLCWQLPAARGRAR